jgi:hypothetical protein
MEITQLLAEGFGDEAMTLTKLEGKGDVSRAEAWVLSDVPVSDREPSFRGWLRVTDSRWSSHRRKAKSRIHANLEAISGVMERTMREQAAL